MNLFNETKSRLFLSICQLINEVYTGMSYNRQELLERLKKLTGFQYDSDDTGNADAIREQELLNALFYFPSNNAPAVLYLNSTISYIPSAIELQWLKTMLLDKEFSWLLPPELARQLQYRLKNIQPLFKENQWTKIRATGDSRYLEKLIPLLSCLQKAFCRNVKVQYINNAANGQCYQGIAAPCRLEYDLAANKYALILWNDAENRAFKVSLSNLAALELTTDTVPADLQQKLAAFYDQPRYTVKLRLENKVNAVERCFSLFSTYDKTSFVDDNLQTYELEIYYYPFDKKEIQRKILSLGSAAIVLAPTTFRQEIIQLLTQAQQYYLE